MKRIYIYILLIFIFSTYILANDNPQSLAERADFYQKLYKVNNQTEKIVDNFGNGCETLYGVRNMRTILFGVAYRGGGNNFYHKTNKRENQMPLPQDGLQNLANEGFSCAVYLYGKNFENSPAKVISANKKDTLRYIQNTLSNNKQIRELLDLVYKVIKTPGKGPVYLHCWNGWHQSGYASALLLMQFCDYSNASAAEYWKKHADGGTKGYEHIVKKINEFKPYPDLKISKEEQKILLGK
jgi:hypothetical protein